MKQTITYIMCIFLTAFLVSCSMQGGNENPDTNSTSGTGGQNEETNTGEDMNESSSGSIEDISMDIPDGYSLYTIRNKGVELFIPDNFRIEDTYSYDLISSENKPTGVAFYVSPDETNDTNLSQDSYFSVEFTDNTTCEVKDFIDTQMYSNQSSGTDENGNEYLLVSGEDVGAGNRYEQSLYLYDKEEECLAVRYFIHYGVIENYPDTVKEFDKNALINTFDISRESLTLTR